MTPEDLLAATDGGTDGLQAVPDLELRMVDPEAIAVDPMNERTDQPLETEDLERSIAKNGVVEPPVCRVTNKDGKVPYTVVQGQRRVTAAQVMQLDEIPILVGEFDDKRALIRSITENIKANQKNVTTKSRAAAIWQLWKFDCAERDKDLSVPDNQVPSPTRIAELLGVNRKTASLWIEPLRKQYKGTNLDAKITQDSDGIEYRQDVDMDDISPKKMNMIRQVATGEEAEKLLREVVEAGLSNQDVREAIEREGASTDPEAAIEEVKTAKQAGQQARGHTLDALRFGGQTGGALSKAERATGKSATELVHYAVEYYLREEGFL
jgi:ParB/RepB/Spo0J family partition protein